MYNLRVTWSDPSLLGIDLEDLLGKSCIKYSSGRDLEWEFPNLTLAVDAFQKLQTMVEQLDTLTLNCSMLIARSRVKFEKRQAALAKLTDEEQKLLGLK